MHLKSTSNIPLTVTTSFQDTCSRYEKTKQASIQMGQHWPCKTPGTRTNGKVTEEGRKRKRKSERKERQRKAEARGGATVTAEARRASPRPAPVAIRGRRCPTGRQAPWPLRNALARCTTIPVSKFRFHHPQFTAHALPTSQFSLAPFRSLSLSVALPTHPLLRPFPFRHPNLGSFRAIRGVCEAALGVLRHPHCGLRVGAGGRHGGFGGPLCVQHVLLHHARPRWPQAGSVAVAAGPWPRGVLWRQGGGLLEGACLGVRRFCSPASPQRFHARTPARLRRLGGP